MTPTPTDFTQPPVLTDPDTILDDDNCRFGLRKADIEDMAKDIHSQGVMVPLEGELLESPTNGKQYRLTWGFLRLAAIRRLKEDGWQGQVPLLIHPNGTPLERTKRQVAENHRRQTMTPMDLAVSIEKLVTNGMPIGEICEMFPRPTAGGQLKPASLAWIYNTMALLKLPTYIKNQLHSGELPALQGYEILRHPGNPERWEAILKDAEAERDKDRKAEVRDQERFDSEQKKVDVADKKKTDAFNELNRANELLAKAQETHSQRAQALVDAHKKLTDTPKDPEHREERKQVLSAFRRAEEAATKSEAAVKTVQQTVASAEQRVQAADTKLKERRRELQQRQAAMAKKRPVTVTQIRKAAKKQGLGRGPTPLTSAEKAGVAEFLATKASYRNVRLIGEILKKCYRGEITEGQCAGELAFRVTREEKTRPKHLRP